MVQCAIRTDIPYYFMIHIRLKRETTGTVQLASSVCFGKHVLCHFIYFVWSQFIAYISLIQENVQMYSGRTANQYG